MIAGVGAGYCKTYIGNCPGASESALAERMGRKRREGPAQNLSLQSAGWEPGSSLAPRPLFLGWWRRPERSWKCKITTCLVSCLFFPGAEKAGLEVCKAESLLAMRPIGQRIWLWKDSLPRKIYGRASSTRFAQRSHPCEGPREVVTAIGGQPVSCGEEQTFLPALASGSLMSTVTHFFLLLFL